MATGLDIQNMLDAFITPEVHQDVCRHILEYKPCRAKSVVSLLSTQHNPSWDHVMSNVQ